MRVDLDLSPLEEALVKAAAAENDKTVEEWILYGVRADATMHFRLGARQPMERDGLGDHPIETRTP